MGLQSSENLNFENFKILNLGLLRQNDILDVAPVTNHKECYKGERWWLPLSSSHGDFCESVCVLVIRPCTKSALTMH